MNRKEQRCKGVQRVLEDYNIEYKKEYNNEDRLKIKNTPYHIEITNKYIGVSYHEKNYYNFLPSFEGIIEFREFIKNNGTNFMLLKDSDSNEWRRTNRNIKSIWKE